MTEEFGGAEFARFLRDHQEQQIDTAARQSFRDLVSGASYDQLVRACIAVAEIMAVNVTGSDRAQELFYQLAAATAYARSEMRLSKFRELVKDRAGAALFAAVSVAAAQADAGVLAHNSKAKPGAVIGPLQSALSVALSVLSSHRLCSETKPECSELMHYQAALIVLVGQGWMQPEVALSIGGDVGAMRAAVDGGGLEWDHAMQHWRIRP